MKKIAYLILAHDDPIHFGKLVRAIDYQSDTYVHIDAKSDEKRFRAECPAGVTFAKRRLPVTWAGISMVDALLSLIEEALRFKDQYTHFIFITGSDYPIKNPKEIYTKLTNNPQHEFVRYIDMRESPEHYMKLITRKYFLEPLFRSEKRSIKSIDNILRKYLRRLRIPNRWSNKIIPYCGHTWCALTPECCSYILEFHKKNPWFYKANKYTFAPDEHYFHTIIGNSSFAANSDGLQDYQGRGIWRLVNFHLICPSLKKWFTLEDWDQISGSDKYFVRKVNSIQGAELVSTIDKELLNKS